MQSPLFTFLIYNRAWRSLQVIPTFYMVKYLKVLISVFAIITFFLSFENDVFAQSREDSIKWAIVRQLNDYPESHYRDVYKNFMQDNYGPGHILEDKKAAKVYLDSELAETEDFGGPLYEPTGYKGNFYRVNLSLIKDGIIPEEKYFDAFVRSLKGIRIPKISDWKKEWGEIEEAYRDLGITLPEEDADRKAIEAQFDRNDFVMHHSDAFNSSANFHYRIFSRRIFDVEIRPLLPAAER